MASFCLLSCFFLSLQVLSHCRLFQNVQDNNIPEKKVKSTESKENDDPEPNLVYPQVYHMSKRRRRNTNQNNMMEESSSLSILVIRTRKEIYYIELQPNDLLNDIPVHFQENDGKTTLKKYQSDCLRVGKILNYPGGVAAVSTCLEDNTLSGILLIDSKAYILRPTSDYYFNETKSDVKIHPHLLSEHQGGDIRFCGVEHGTHVAEALSPGKSDFFDWANDTMRFRRTKRADIQHRKVMEVAVFADSELYDRIESTSAVDPQRAIVRRVLGIMNQVQLIYSYASLDTKFKLVIVKLEILKGNASAPLKDKGNIDNYLDNFCNWQSKLNGREGKSGHWDHAIMLTGMDLFKEDDGKKNSKVLGLAWVNGMCRSNYSCTLNEGTSFEAAFVIAHEMGHSLGIMHDGSGNNCDRNKFIMSDKTGPGKVNWSACSNAYIKKFFRSGYGWCLEDDASPPNRSYDLQVLDLPGLKYSLEDQCQLALGMQFVPFQENKEPFNNVCRELWCADGTWAKPAHPALEGSSCGNKKQCLQGSCRRERPISRRMGAMPSPTPTVRRSTRRTHMRNRFREGNTPDWIERAVLKMIQDLGR